MGSTIPVAVVLGCIRKLAEHEFLNEPASSECSFMVSAVGFLH